MTDYPELKNCPFCGSIAHLQRTMQAYPAEGKHPAGEVEIYVNVNCDNCGFALGGEHQDEAIAAWNFRSGPEGKALGKILQAINTFDAQCAQAQHTDSEEVWVLLHEWRDLIKPLVPETPLEEEET